MSLGVCWSNCTSGWALSEIINARGKVNLTDLGVLLDNMRDRAVSLTIAATWLELRDQLETALLKHYHYLPLTPLVLWLYPLLFTLVVLPVVSASTWFFWILTSLTLGALQLVYVMYQFTLIGVDLAGLSVLKTFALVRSWVLSTYYYASMHHKHNQAHGHRPYRGRKRLWREYLATVKQYADFAQLEILEPDPQPLRRGSCFDRIHDPRQDTMKRMGTERIVKLVFTGFRQMNFTFLSAPIRFIVSCLGSWIRSKQEPSMGKTDLHKPRRTKSCMEIILNPFPSQTDTLTPLGDESRPSQGFKAIPTTTSSHTFQDMTRSTSFNISTSNTNNRNTALDHELGMIGTMLSTTTQRLQEARLQCQQLNHNQDNNNNNMINKDNTSLESIHGVFWNIPESDKDSLHHTIIPKDPQEQDRDASVTPPPSSTNPSTTTLPDLAVLKYLLTGIVKRNHLNAESILVDNAQLVMEYGRHRLSKDSRNLIHGYYQEVQACLDYIADSEVIPSLCQKQDISHPISPKDDDDLSNLASEQHNELYDRIHLMRKMRHNVGRTALMLSGGGAQAMYHLGTIKALCESGLYQDITVISGTSGGSITAAMCAIKTPEELLNDVCVTHVSTDYMLSGEMKRQNIRWFPKVVDMGMFWLQHGLLVDSKEFKRCCDFYFSDITFEEAFMRTGKHVCITVSASRAGDNGSSSGDGSQRLLLNHISTPHVTIASAVACSCALPGVMAPGKLITKTSNNEQEYFEVDGVEWIDGSVQADLPFKRISTLFNVSNYIVCQTNFHVVPFLHKPHHPSTKSWYWRVFQLCEWDIRSRALNLSRLGLFPKIFGQDISKVFKQKYHGDLTIVPRFTTMQVFGLKALINPTVEDMEVYIQNGQAATWPYISVIREMLRIESTIDRCINRLNERVRSISSDHGYLNDDVESVTSADGASFSLASSSKAPTRYLSQVHKETETLRSKVKSLEQENQDLRRRLDQLQQALGQAISI